MTTIGEEFSDGIEKCPNCGSVNLIIETISYLFIKRDENLKVIYEFDADETDTRITCQDCEQEF